MNILIFSWRGPGHPKAGGAEQVSHEHAKYWIQKGHSVTLFTSSFERSKSFEVIDGVEVLRQGTEKLVVHICAFLWFVFGKHEKFDLVVDEVHGIPFFTPLYVRGKKLAFIHEVAKEVWWLNFNYLVAFMGFTLEPFIFKFVYKDVPFMTVSESTKKDLINFGIPARYITVVHNGVRTVKVTIKKEKRKTAMFIGALAKDKGIEDALKVFSLINEKEPGWQFWVVGKGAAGYLKFLRSLCKNLGIENRVKFFGFVSEKKKFVLFSKAHVLINPSIREGWGLVNIEANSVATPVVGYDVAGMRDSVVSGKTGELVKVGDIDQLASETINLVSSSVYKRFQKNAILWSRRFSWDRSGKQSLELIENLTSREK